MVTLVITLVVRVVDTFIPVWAGENARSTGTQPRSACLSSTVVCGRRDAPSAVLPVANSRCSMGAVAVVVVTVGRSTAAINSGPDSEKTPLVE